MDGFTREDLPEEYAALGDRVSVMAEVVEAIESVRGGTRKLGDALVAAGLPAREWLGAPARLHLLDDAMPDITLDDVITRLAEFAAGSGPDWLRGDRADIGRFNDETAILEGVLRVLRQVAQRERMASVRRRSDLPIRRALADARVGTQLDLLSRDLRDLLALAPFIAPLTPAEWATLSSASQPAASLIAAPPQAQAQAPQTPQSVAPPPPSTSPQHTRLRDFAPPPQAPENSPRPPVLSVRLGEAMERVRVQTRALAERIMPRKWLALGGVALVLVVATALLSLTASPSSHTSTPALTVSPASVTLRCAAKAPAVGLTLRDNTKVTLTWSVTLPAGFQLSATHGALKAGATVKLAATAHGAKAGKGSLVFTSAGGKATIPYTVTCP